MRVGRTRLSSRRNTSTASRSPAQRLTSAGSASCNSSSVRERRLSLESAMPTHRCALELLLLQLGEEVEVVERVVERDGAQFAKRGFGGPKVALLDRASGSSMCRAL